MTIAVDLGRKATKQTNKTVLFLKYNRFNGFVKRNLSETASLNTDSQWSEQEACFARGVASCRSQHQCHFWRISSMLVNVRSVLHGQVSLAAVNQNTCNS